MLKKIVIIGPESTGKSLLSEQLASHYHSLWCPEYAREYLLKNGKNYTYNDLLEIAKGQLNLEDACTNKLRASMKSKNQESALLFIDTNMYVMQVWAEFVFGKCHRFILDQLVERKYDLYLLCDIDLPWVKDELREYPDIETRKKLYNMYKEILVNQPVPWAVISGNHHARLQNAIDIVNSIAGKK